MRIAMLIGATALLATSAVAQEGNEPGEPGRIYDKGDRDIRVLNQNATGLPDTGRDVTTEDGPSDRAAMAERLDEGVAPQTPGEDRAIVINRNQGEVEDLPTTDMALDPAGDDEQR